MKIILNLSFVFLFSSLFYNYFLLVLKLSLQKVRKSFLIFSYYYLLMRIQKKIEGGLTWGGSTFDDVRWCNAYVSSEAGGKGKVYKCIEERGGAQKSSWDWSFVPYLILGWGVCNSSRYIINVDYSICSIHNCTTWSIWNNL